jgi:hypothetical protein
MFRDVNFTVTPDEVAEMAAEFDRGMAEIEEAAKGLSIASLESDEGW